MLFKRNRMVDKVVTVRSWNVSEFSDQFLGLYQVANSFDKRAKWRKFADPTRIKFDYQNVTLTEAIVKFYLHVTEDAYEVIKDYLWTP